MSAEILRRAASLMRERVEAATPGPWEHFGDHLVWPSDKGPAANDPILAMVGEAHEDTAPHIASWHPAVALAVADVLDAEVRRYEADVQWYRDERDCGRYPYNSPQVSDEALSLARAYLGEPA